MLDLDGTTIENRIDALPSEKVVEAISMVQEKIFVCVATGRSIRKASPILDILKVTNPVILLGGSQIIDGKSRKYIYEKPIRDEDVLKVIEILKKHPEKIMIDEKEKAVEYCPSYKLKTTYNLFPKYSSIEAADKIAAELSHINTIATHKVINWEKGTYILDITHAEATKQHAIYEVAKILGIDTHEIIGVGDGYNDFPLLMACGLKVAMGNAVPELKEIADYIAPTVKEDGVVDVIQKFVL